MSMLIFSIIVPAYNCSGTIERLFASLEKQSIENFEVIIVDDCSRDNSVKTIRDYIKNSRLNIKLLSTEKNSGPSTARELGIKEAVGKYICFIDSDDYVAENYISALSDIISQDNPDLVYFGCCQIIGKKRIAIKPSIYYNKGSQIAFSRGSLCMYAIKKYILHKYPMPKIKNAEDVALIPLIIKSADKICYYNDVLYYYVHNSDSLSSKSSPRVTNNFVKSLDYTLSFLNKPYGKDIEFHGIKTILYGAILNGIKAKIPFVELETIIIDFEKKFPQWYYNPYLKIYSFNKRVFLKLVQLKLYPLLKGYVKVHNLLLKYS